MVFSSPDGDPASAPGRAGLLSARSSAYTPRDEAEGGEALSTYLQRIAAGDAAAVEECLDAYSGLVWTLARRMTRSTAAPAWTMSMIRRGRFSESTSCCGE